MAPEGFDDLPRCVEGGGASGPSGVISVGPRSRSLGAESMALFSEDEAALSSERDEADRDAARGAHPAGGDHGLEGADEEAEEDRGHGPSWERKPKVFVAGGRDLELQIEGQGVEDWRKGSFAGAQNLIGGGGALPALDPTAYLLEEAGRLQGLVCVSQGCVLGPAEVKVAEYHLESVGKFMVDGAGCHSLDLEKGFDGVDGSRHGRAWGPLQS